MANCKVDITLCDEKFESCGDVGVSFNGLLTTDITSMTTLKGFNDTVSTELIDVKGWKTMSSYPTLKLLYERYMNSMDYCDTLSSQFTYSDMINFSELVGTYWVDLIEQVVPSTTIWGSTYVYGNTIFDQQKFKYKKYSLFTCDDSNPITGSLPSPSSGSTNDVEVIMTTLANPVDDIISTGEAHTIFISAGTETNEVTTTSTSTTTTLSSGCDDSTTCVGVNVWQINVGSEFTGTITVIGGDDSDTHKVNNNDVQVFHST